MLVERKGELRRQGQNSVANETEEGGVAMVPESTVQALDAANHLARELEHWKRKARKLGKYAAAQRQVARVYAYSIFGATMSERSTSDHVGRMVRMAMRKPW